MDGLATHGLTPNTSLCRSQWHVERAHPLPLGGARIAFLSGWPRAKPPVLCPSLVFLVPWHLCNFAASPPLLPAPEASLAQPQQKTRRARCDLGRVRLDHSCVSGQQADGRKARGTVNSDFSGSKPSVVTFLSLACHLASESLLHRLLKEADHANAAALLHSGNKTLSMEGNMSSTRLLNFSTFQPPPAFCHMVS